MVRYLLVILLAFCMILPKSASAAVAFSCTATQNEPTAAEVHPIPMGQFFARVDFKTTYTFNITGAAANQVFFLVVDQSIKYGVRPNEPSQNAVSWVSPDGYNRTCNGMGEYSSGNIPLEGFLNQTQGLYNTKSTMHAHDFNNVGTSCDASTGVRNYSVSF